ncbi:MAG: hypothetical protein ACYDBZ_18650 [Steroidobacteraceae bacterium]
MDRGDWPTGWIAVSRDARIRYSPLALGVLMESGTQLFVLVGKLTTAEAAGTFLKWRERIVETVVSERGHRENPARWGFHLASPQGLARRATLNS